MEYIRPAEPKDASACGRLRYMAETELCDYVFGGEKSTRKFAEFFYGKPDVMGSQNYTSIYDCDGEVAGNIHMYPIEKDEELTQNISTYIPEALLRVGPTVLLRAYFRSKKLMGSKHFTWENSLYINQLSVSPEFRRRGIAQRLIEHAKEEAEKKDKTDVRLRVFANNDPARKLYEALGFEVNAVQDMSAFYRYQLSDLLDMVLKINPEPQKGA